MGYQTLITYFMNSYPMSKWHTINSGANTKLLQLPRDVMS